ESGAGTRPIHCRNHRLRQCTQGTGDLLPLAQNSSEPLFVFVLAKMLQMIDVSASTEAPAFAGNDQNPKVFIRSYFGQEIQNLIPNRPAERVELFRSVQRQESDRALSFINNGAVHVRSAAGRVA